MKEAEPRFVDAVLTCSKPGVNDAKAMWTSSFSCDTGTRGPQGIRSHQYRSLCSGHRSLLGPMGGIHRMKPQSRTRHDFSHADCPAVDDSRPGPLLRNATRNVLHGVGRIHPVRRGPSRNSSRRSPNREDNREVDDFNDSGRLGTTSRSLGVVSHSANCVGHCWSCSPGSGGSF
jgi:hypothetical protein